MSFCPKWVYEAACAGAGAEYLSRQIDLRTVASGYANVLSEFYSPISADEVAAVIEPTLRFLDELNSGDSAEPLLRGFCYYRITYEQPNKLRRLKGIFGSADEPVKTKEFSPDTAVKAFKAYVFAIRNEVAEMAPAGWNRADVEGSQVLERLFNQKLSPLDFI
ncbi:hypothetical protein OAN95_00375 [Alphaproteobacteria bacterium]|nr:hypothetical protein [Alphaproteobacteria bacterium]